MNNRITMDSDHIYRVNGIVVPGVSSLLVEFGLIDENVIRFADTSLGSAVHKACELDDLGILDIDSCEGPVRERLCYWQQFGREHSPLSFAYNEDPLYSKLGFCGTPDRVARIGGKYVLIDIKTSKVRSKSTKVQLAFYKRLVEESLGVDINGVWEVVLADKRYEIVDHYNLVKETSIMRSILNIHYYKKG